MTKKIFILFIVIIVLSGLYKLLSNKPQTVQKDNLQLQITPTIKTNMEQLKIEDIKIGEGQEVKSGDIVVMHYNGTLENGQKFDSSYDRNQPFETEIGVGRVIKGWDQGVPGMKIGGKRKLTIPSDLAYGDNGIPGAIPPKATLIFEVELINIK
jgi:FKBP-type peptidyl-prolyl cis-trans isomerase